jgi:hypothetical protein
MAMTGCKIDGCECVVQARGLCKKHYGQEYRRSRLTWQGEYAERAQERTQRASEDRDRFDELLGRYEAGELVPDIDSDVVSRLIHNLLNVKPAYEKFKLSIPSADGALTREEKRLLEDLAGLVALQEMELE